MKPLSLSYGMSRHPVHRATLAFELGVFMHDIYMCAEQQHLEIPLPAVLDGAYVLGIEGF